MHMCRLLPVTRTFVTPFVILSVLTACGGPTTSTHPLPGQEPGVEPGPAPGVPQVPAVITFDGPLMITAGGTYSGAWESSDPNVPAVSVRTSEPVVIENAFVRGPGHLIRASFVNADLEVRNVYGEGVRLDRAGLHPGRFVLAERGARLVVERSSMVGTAGIYLYQPSSNGTIRIVGNRALNIDGRRSDGRGGTSGAALVQFFQINNGTSLRDTVVAWNEIVNEPYQSGVEDVINLFRTSGRHDSPVRIHDNFIRGAFPTDPARDRYFGGGIMLGDAGGAYLHAYRNHVVGTSNYGVAIAGGHDNRIHDNRVVGCGRLADGTVVPSMNVGIYIWNYSRSGNWGNNRGIANHVGYVGKDGRRGDWWVPDATEWRDNRRLFDGGTVPCSAEDDEHARWLQKVTDAGITLAPPITPVPGSDDAVPDAAAPVGHAGARVRNAIAPLGHD